MKDRKNGVGGRGGGMRRGLGEAAGPQPPSVLAFE